MATVSESCWKPQRRESRIAWVYSSKMTSNKKDDHSQDTRYPRVIINCFTTMVLGYSTKSGNSFCLSFGDDDAVFIHLGTLMVILWDASSSSSSSSSSKLFLLQIINKVSLAVMGSIWFNDPYSSQRPETMIRWTIAFSPCLDGSYWAQNPPGMALDTFTSLTLASWSDGAFFQNGCVTNQNPPIHVPSWELTYPIKNYFEDDFPFPKVGYVSSLEGTFSPHNSRGPSVFSGFKKSLVFPFTRPAMKPLWICGGWLRLGPGVIP